MEDLRRTYWMYTILRNGNYRTIIDAHSNPLVFLAIEKEFGNDTVILNQIELTKEEYEFGVQNL